MNVEGVKILPYLWSGLCAKGVSAAGVTESPEGVLMEELRIIALVSFRLHCRSIQCMSLDGVRNTT